MKGNTRILSVDVFRGLTVMMMTLVNNPGDWGHIYAPLEHAAWHGWTPTDLVFPFFLFIVGVSVVLANPTKDRNSMKIATRTMRIFLLGLSLSFFSKIHVGDWEGAPLLAIRLVYTALVFALLVGNYPLKKQFYVALGLLIFSLFLCFSGMEAFATVRIPGVLQRIALVYAGTSCLYLCCSSRVLWGIFMFILLLYWGLMALVPVPGVGPANVEVGTNLAAWLDNYLLPGHLWITSKTWDPEGILSTLPAMGTGILGVLVGQMLWSGGAKELKKVALLGGLFLIIGLVWSHIFPINKSLWTSSYVLLAGGFAMLFLAGIYYWIEVRGERKGIKLFQLFGANPMLVFFFSGIIPRALNMIKIEEKGLIAWLNVQGIQVFFKDPYLASLAGALVYLFIWGIILVLFDRKKLIFKV
jgi:predicted acyltransferase